MRLLFSAATDRTVGVWGDRGQQLQVPHAHADMKLLSPCGAPGQALLGAHAAALFAGIRLTSQPAWLITEHPGLKVGSALGSRIGLSHQSRGQRCTAGGAVRWLGARAGMEPAAAAAGGGPQGAGGPVHGAVCAAGDHTMPAQARPCSHRVWQQLQGVIMGLHEYRVLPPLDCIAACAAGAPRGVTAAGGLTAANSVAPSQD